MASEPLRVGIVGASIHHSGFATVAHLPALQALPQFTISAVCTTRQESADESARHLGASFAYTDVEQLAQSQDVDVVVVCVRVPSHFRAVMAAIQAHKHVYCEWPLGRNLDEARQMCDAAQQNGIHHMIGLQARRAPSVNCARDLIARGDIGRVLSANMTAYVERRAVGSDRAFQHDSANGMNHLTITGGHTLDLLQYCLGDLREFAAFEVIQYPESLLTDTKNTVRKSTLDQLVISGIIGDDIAVSYQIQGGGSGSARRFSFTIHGEEGDLLLTSLPTSQESMQRQPLTISIARGSEEFVDLEVPDRYRWVPPDMPSGSPFNVAQMYVKLAESIHDATPAEPGFDVAVACHQLLDGVDRASDSRQTQSSKDFRG